MAFLTNKQASSSSSSITRQYKYDVFLSFRGEDTRLDFTSNLNGILKLKGIHTFIDDELPRGEEISTELLEAIRNSRSSIIVFSENYASSKWCLDELVEILECKENGQMVLPVFYKVDPSEVRNQRGKFGEALAKHEVNNTKKVQKWREALNKVGSISGLTYKDGCSCSQFEFIEEIFKEISSAQLNHMKLSVAKYLVGIDTRVNDVINRCLDTKSNDLRIIGIFGLPGVDNELSMHDLIQQMGWEIVRQESPEVIEKRSRLLCYEDALEILTENTGSNEVRGITLCLPKPKNMKLNLEKMRNLKYLKVRNVICEDLESLPNGLRLLDWNEFPLSSLPSAFEPKSLVVLNMQQSHIKLDEHFERCRFETLTYMNLSYCKNITKLREIPMPPPHLEDLYTVGCGSLDSHSRRRLLSQLGETFGLPQNMELRFQCGSTIKVLEALYHSRLGCGSQRSRREWQSYRTWHKHQQQDGNDIGQRGAQIVVEGTKIFFVADSIVSRAENS
nr:isoform 2 of tmv resistance protein n [Quercus suber]